MTAVVAELALKTKSYVLSVLLNSHIRAIKLPSVGEPHTPVRTSRYLIECPVTGAEPGNTLPAAHPITTEYSFESTPAFSNVAVIVSGWFGLRTIKSTSSLQSLISVSVVPTSPSNFVAMILSFIFVSLSMGNLVMTPSWLRSVVSKTDAATSSVVEHAELDVHSMSV